MLGLDIASATRTPPMVHSCISGLCDRFMFSTSKPAGTRSTSSASGMFWLEDACTQTTSMSPVCSVPPSHARPSGRYQPRLSWITSLRGDGVTVGLPWMSYSTNRDWLPLLVSCVEARSAGASDTVASALPPVTLAHAVDGQRGFPRRVLVAADRAGRQQQGHLFLGGQIGTVAQAVRQLRQQHLAAVVLQAVLAHQRIGQRVITHAAAVVAHPLVIVGAVAATDDAVLARHGLIQRGLHAPFVAHQLERHRQLHQGSGERARS